MPLFFSACQSLEELYAAGDYDKSFKAALRQLEKKPSDAKALMILEQSLEQLITAQQAEFTRLRKTGDPETWEKALDVIADMDALLVEAQPYLSEPFAAEQTVWWADALALEEQLYIHYLDRGKENLEESIAQNNAALGQEAYYDFSRAIHYQKPDFPETNQLENYLREAEEAGIVRYNVNIDKGFNMGLSFEIDRAFSDISSRGGQFLKIEQGVDNTNCDCQVDIRLGSFDHNTRESSTRQDFTQSIITDYQTQTDTSGRTTQIPIYTDVRGWVETITSTKVADWEVRVDFDQLTPNCEANGQRFTRTYTSRIEYYRTGGDERAIPDQYKNNFNRDQHPDDDDMAEELLEELVDLIYREYF